MRKPSACSRQDEGESNSAATGQAKLLRFSAAAMLAAERADAKTRPSRHATSSQPCSPMQPRGDRNGALHLFATSSRRRNADHSSTRLSVICYEVLRCASVQPSAARPLLRTFDSMWLACHEQAFGLPEAS